MKQTTTCSRYSIISQAINTLHPPLVKGIANALFLIFDEGRYADKVVPQLLKIHPEWGSRDRRLVAEGIYDSVRWWRYYWFLMDEDPAPEKYEELVRQRPLLQGIRTGNISHDIPPRLTERQKLAQTARMVRESIPDWLDLTGHEQLGQRWDSELKALNEQASTFIRVNLSKAGRSTLLKQLQNAGINCLADPEVSSAIKLPARIRLENLASYKQGLFEIQDPGSQMIVPFLDPKPGEIIIDACAGAGGKTLHIADYVGDKSSIIAMDVETWKLDNLLNRAQKSGFRSISTLPLGNTFPANLTGTADRLLLDVPCSGLGVLKRNPDTKWKLTQGKLEALQQTQRMILSRYTSFLKPGGTMVYATCSILPAENRLQVQEFLDHNPAFSLIASHMQWPSMGFDGFYMAKIKKAKTL